MPKRNVAILLSRQPLRPCGSDLWVRQVMAAVQWIKSQNLRLCTSIGQPNWELPLAVASLHQAPVRITIVAANGDEQARLEQQTIEQFALDPTQVEFYCITPPAGVTDKEQLLLQRDGAVVSASDLLLPVSVRQNGHMQQLIGEAGSGGKEIDDRFRIEYRGRTESLAYELTADQLNPELSLASRDSLVHWTRTAKGPWPNERKIDYYSSIIESAGYPRSAFCTLLQILMSNRVVATDKHMPHRIATVSFSGLRPADTIPLMKWRARYRQMSLEPYGIAIERNTALTLGIRPVQYYHRGETAATVNIEPWLRQSRGNKGDWQAECEFRCRGDLSLTRIPRDKLHAFCLTRREADLITRVTGISATSFQP